MWVSIPPVCIVDTCPYLIAPYVLLLLGIKCLIGCTFCPNLVYFILKNDSLTKIRLMSYFQSSFSYFHVNSSKKNMLLNSNLLFPWRDILICGIACVHAACLYHAWWWLCRIISCLTRATELILTRQHLWCRTTRTEIFFFYFRTIDLWIWGLLGWNQIRKGCRWGGGLGNWFGVVFWKVKW